MGAIVKRLFGPKFLGLILLLAVWGNAQATIYDADRFVKCPKCGHILREISLISGNTFNSTLWSDGKLETPMLPSVPQFVQCPECGKFYAPKDNHCELTPQQQAKVEKVYTEHLDFDQWIKAFPLVKDKRQAYRGIWHTYNDLFRKQDMKAYDMLYNVFVFYAEKFIDELNTARNEDRLFRAELCREIGRFDQCIELLDQKKFPGKMKPFADKVREAALRKDQGLFKVFEPSAK